MKPHKTPSGIAQQPGENPPAPERSNRLRPRRRPLVLLAAITPLLAAAGAVSLAASGPAAVIAPTITARPADPANQTSAHFTYSDPQSGVSYQCQLDNAAFNSCPAGGVTYSGPLSQGNHSFKVRATVGSKTSSTTSLSWTIDTTPPDLTLSSPANGSTFGASAWTDGCPRHGGICGRVKDSSGVHSVLVSIQKAGGKWWGGSAFDQSAESFRTVGLSSPERNSSDWSYALALPADGVYTIHARATDDAGNTTPAARQSSATFTIDTTPPPSPSIVSGPGASTTSKAATFTFTDSEHSSTFICERNDHRDRRCSSPRSYSGLSLGAHTFRVWARDAVGNLSAPTTYSWTISKTIEEGKSFTVTGNTSAPLAPGLARPLAVTVSNPNNTQIFLTSLSVGVAAGSTKAGCDGPTNLQLTQSNLSSTNTLTVPANGQASLPSGPISAPSVLMKDLSSNQDACKNASFTFTYTGSAHS
jgi:hypothetical protein